MCEVASGLQNVVEDANVAEVHQKLRGFAAVTITFLFIVPLYPCSASRRSILVIGLKSTSHSRTQPSLPPVAKPSSQEYMLKIPACKDSDKTNLFSPETMTLSRGRETERTRDREEQRHLEIKKLFIHFPPFIQTMIEGYRPVWTSQWFQLTQRSNTQRSISSISRRGPGRGVMLRSSFLKQTGSNVAEDTTTDWIKTEKYRSNRSQM